MASSPPPNERTERQTPYTYIFLNTLSGKDGLKNNQLILSLSDIFLKCKDIAAAFKNKLNDILPFEIEFSDDEASSEGVVSPETSTRPLEDDSVVKIKRKGKLALKNLKSNRLSMI